MANFVHTQVILASNESSDLIALLNLLRKTDGHAMVSDMAYYATMPDDETFSLRSIIGKMPQTYVDYDTTNYKSESLQQMLDEGRKELYNGQPLTQELVDAYKRAEEEQRKLGAVGWYDYNIMTLGTKWNSHMQVVNVDEKHITFYVDTAWDVATPVYEALSKLIADNHLNVDMHVRYREETDAFMGTYDNDDEGGLIDCEVDVNYTDDFDGDSDFFTSWEDEEWADVDD